MRANVGDLTPGISRRRVFKVTPLRRGTIRIVVSGSGAGGNQPAVSRTLVVH
jgi:hypothetical protein